MEAQVRYPELFLAPRSATEESFWISLGYFNLYRIAVATLFFTLTLIYDDELKFGAHWLDLFRYVAVGYLFLALLFHGVLRSREQFNLQLSLHVCLDVVAITLLMYASGGFRSGLGVMLLISLIAAAIVAPRRLSFLYAALASIALLLEQGYWVLAHDAPTTDFLQPSLLAMSCFAGAGITGWLAQRVATNERLARQRGRELEMQTRVNQLVIQDMHDGVVVLDHDGRVVQHNPQAQRLLRAERVLGVDIASQRRTDADIADNAAVTEGGQIDSAEQRQADQYANLFRAFLKDVLVRRGFTVHEARDGEEALRVALERRPWLIVTDVNMPRVDGVEFCRRVRSHSLIRHTPLIFLSGWDDYKDRYRGLEAGADEFLSKDTSIRELLIRIQILLKRYSDLGARSWRGPGMEGRVEVVGAPGLLQMCHLGRLTGLIDVEEVLGAIFGEFCIGK